MASNYPGAVDTFRAKANVPGQVFNSGKTTRLYVEDIKALEDDILAVQNTLGVNPQGAYDSVVERLDDDGGGGGTWGTITGDIADQTDLQDALDAKENALGFTPEDSANKKTTLADNSDTYYPSQKAVKTAVDAKENALGFTPENVTNKDTDGTLASNSDTKYPSQKAVKTYVDANISGALVANISLSATQIKAITTGSPFTLISAPGANKLIVVESIVFSFSYVGPAYTSGDIMVVYYDTTTLSPVTNNISTALMTGTASWVERRGRYSDFTYTTCVNKALVWREQTSGQYATGNGTMKIIIKYYIASV